MSGVLGLFLVLFGILLMAAMRVVIENPNRPGWANWSPLGGVVAISFMVLMIIGVALIIDFGFEFSTTQFGVLEMLLMALEVIIAAVCWRMLRPGQRLAGYRTAKAKL